MVLSGKWEKDLIQFQCLRCFTTIFTAKRNGTERKLVDLFLVIFYDDFSWTGVQFRRGRHDTREDALPAGAPSSVPEWSEGRRCEPPGPYPLKSERVVGLGWSPVDRNKGHLRGLSIIQVARIHLHLRQWVPQRSDYVKMSDPGLYRWIRWFMGMVNLPSNYG